MITIAGISILVNKKNIKNMHLYVKPPNGDVVISAPLGMSDDAIERFARMKLGWIMRQQEKFQTQARQSKREYVSGETLYVWGKQYFLQTEHGNKNTLFLSGEKAILTVREESTAEQRDNFVREWYRELLKVEMERLLPKWENITGLRASSWQSKYMTTRWGTCNTETRKIWINVQLAKKPIECLEYIILHELVHLIEKKHDAKFIAQMDKYMPLWRELKVTLNGHSLDYME